MMGLLLVVAAAATACSSDPADNGPEVSAEVSGALTLGGTSWVLLAYGPIDDAIPGVADAQATLTFDVDGRAAGFTGCNRFSATWSQQADDLSLDLGPVTRAACTSEELTAQEQAILMALPEAAAFQLSEGTLSLLDSTGTTLLRYLPARTDLAGTSWTATGVNNQTGGVESTLLSTTVTATFADDGVLSGFSGCRDYEAAWETTDDTISITGVVTEGSACTGEEAALEQQYLSALDNAATFALEGSTLNLRDSDGATQVNYSRAAD